MPVTHALAGKRKQIAREVLAQTNLYRAQHGLDELQWDDAIYRIAKKHAKSMANGESPFDHTNVEQRYEALPYHTSAGENLSKLPHRPHPAEPVVEGWINSPTHRDNLIGEYNKCAVGVAMDKSTNTYYMTQLFLQDE